jgi:hypothetical protein
MAQESWKIGESFAQKVVEHGISDEKGRAVGHQLTIFAAASWTEGEGRPVSEGWRWSAHITRGGQPFGACQPNKPLAATDMESAIAEVEAKIPRIRAAAERAMAKRRARFNRA